MNDWNFIEKPDKECVKKSLPTYTPWPKRNNNMNNHRKYIHSLKKYHKKSHENLRVKILKKKYNQHLALVNQPANVSVWNEVIALYWFILYESQKK